MEAKDIDLLIAKKQNAEAYKEGIKDLEKEIKEIQQKIELTMSSEEKSVLRDKLKQKEEEVKNLKSTYDNKRETIEDEILTLKNELTQNIEEIESRLISKEEADKLKESRAAKEIELAECENNIKEVKEELKKLIDKDGGYEQDTVSLSKKLDDLTAYRKYIRDEEIPEIENKLKNAIIIEENMDAIKEIKYMKTRLANLSYSSIERWKEEEEKTLKAYFDKRQQEPPKQEPPKQEPPKTELKWHKKLTPEQIEEAISRGIYTPEGQEYEQFLDELGIGMSGKENQSSPLGTQRGAPIGTNPPNQERGKAQTPPTPPKPPVPPTPPNPPKSKKEVTRLIINPLENKIDYYFNDNEHKLIGWKGEYISRLNYDNSKIKNVISVLENIGEEADLSDISEMIDPNIVELLASKSKEFDIQIDDYLNMLRGKDSNFDIEYDLRDIYNSNLDYKQIKKIIKIAKLANIKTNGAISYERDNILRRAYGNIKKRIEYFKIKMLDSAEEQEKKEKNKDNDPKNGILSRTKKKTKEKLNDVKHFTSKKLSSVKQFGRKTLGTLNIAGTRISGYFKGENPLVTNMKVNNIRAKSFIPQATVDEKAAVERVEASQRQNEEVIIENPDRTK